MWNGLTSFLGPSSIDRQQQNGKVMLVDFNKENLRHVILDDFSRALAWTGMLAPAVDNSLDDEEEPHRTFDFDTEDLLK